MSGTAYNWGRWLGNPLPFYDDPANAQAYQQTLGGYTTAQDTAGARGGTGWSDPSAQVPYTAPSTGGTLGGFPMPPYSGGGTGGPDTYDGFPLPPFPGSGWSAPSTQVPYSAPSTAGGTSVWDLPEWAYGGNQKGGGTYNQQTGQWDNGAPLAAGSDVFGAKLPVGYDSAQDRGGLEYNGRNVETFWSRMLRFARDFRDGAARAGQTLTAEQAMQQALDRIRTDNGGTLAGTGFQEGGGATGAPVTTTTTTGGGGSTGGKTVDPSNSTGLPIPGGTPTPSTVPGAPVPMGPLNSIGGKQLSESPELAWRYLISQMGGDPDYEGPFSGYMKSNFAPALAAMIQAKLAGAGRAPGAEGLSGMDQIGNYIGQFGGMLGGNDLFTKLGGIGAQGLAAGGGLLNTASSQDASNFVRQMMGLTGMGNGPLGQSAQQYLTNKMVNDYTMQGLGTEKGYKDKFGTYFQNSGFLDRLRQFGLLR